MKQLGFNTLRKHIKVEPEEFYYQCDRLGMIVFQDMVNNGDYRFLRDTGLPGTVCKKRKDHRLHRDPDSRKAFLTSMEETVAQLQNHPSILYWTIFNEGWGQFEADKAYDRLCSLDESRIIDATSGWFWQNKSHVDSHHIYFGGWKAMKPRHRPVVLSEFGGFICPIAGHRFKDGKAFGYRYCATAEKFRQRLIKLYRKRILPAIPKGLSGAILTQLSDVEEEINGLVTYDRQVIKADEKAMQLLARELQKAMTKDAR
jgi:beta-galactosidase/beta-glucuronidase